MAGENKSIVAGCQRQVGARQFLKSRCVPDMGGDAAMKSASQTTIGRCEVMVGACQTMKSWCKPTVGRCKPPVGTCQPTKTGGETI